MNNYIKIIEALREVKSNVESLDAQCNEKLRSLNHLMETRDREQARLNAILTLIDQGLVKEPSTSTEVSEPTSVVAPVAPVEPVATPAVEVAPEAPKPPPVKAKKAKKGPPPRLIEACQMVMGYTPIHNNDIFLRLKENGCLPNSSDPKAYVRQVLSANPSTFLRVETRGFYHLAKGNKFYNPDNDVAAVVVQTPKEEAPKKEAPKKEAPVKPLPTQESSELMDELIREYDEKKLRQV